MLSDTKSPLSFVIDYEATRAGSLVGVGEGRNGTLPIAIASNCLRAADHTDRDTDTTEGLTKLLLFVQWSRP